MTTDQITIPPFVSPSSIYRRIAADFRPPRRISVVEAAEKHLMISRPDYRGPWSSSTTPYMREPMNAVRSRSVGSVIFVGPAQVTGKTEGLIHGVLVHAITCDPIDMMVVQMTKDQANIWSRGRLRRIVDANRSIRDLLHSDTMLYKRFGRMTLKIGYPSASVLASDPIPLVLITDYDRMPINVDGEGTVYVQARGRIGSFGSLGTIAAESSPKALFEGEWTPDGHFAPPMEQHGILSLYNEGDKRRLYWQCLECKSGFEVVFDLLRPSVSGGAVMLACPHCGCLYSQHQRQQLNDRHLWVPHGHDYDPDRIGHGYPLTQQVSYWMFGPAGGSCDWTKLYHAVMAARSEYERSGDDTQLRAVTNVNIGDVYYRKRAEDRDALDAQQLQRRAEPDWSLGQVPDGVRALVLTVDVQGTWFDWQVTGFGPDFECWVVDRGHITIPYDGADRMVSPGSYLEDWALLQPLLTHTYLLADGSGREMAILTGVVDSGGSAGVTGNAYAWAESIRQGRAGLPPISEDRLILLKGESRLGNRKISIDRIDMTRDGKMLARGRRILKVNTDSLKSDVAAGLRRADPGPGYLHTPHDLAADWYDQVTAETMDKSGHWSKQRDRNEAFDHLVYARAALLRRPYAWDVINWQNPPPWASRDGNGHIFLPQDNPPSAPMASPKPPPDRPVRRVGRSSYLGRLGR